MESALSFFFSTVAVIAALMVVTSRRPTYSVLYLLLCMFAIAGLFVLLQAYFLAAIQVIVYAGAILVLFLFVIMLLGLEDDVDAFTAPAALRWLCRLTAVGFFVEIIWMITQGREAPLPPAGTGIVGSTASVGEVLFTQALLPFELTSILILAAIVGAVVLARKKSAS